MPMQVQCANCHGVMTVADHLRGRAVRCPRCQAATQVPGGYVTQMGGPRMTQVANGAGRRRTTIAPQHDDDYSSSKYDNVPRPRRSRKPKGNGAAVWVASLGLLLAVGAIVAGVLYIKHRDNASANKRTNPKDGNQTAVDVPETKFSAALQYVPAGTDYALGVDMTAIGGTTMRSLLLKHFAENLKELVDLAPQVEHVIYAGSSQSPRLIVIGIMKKEQPQEDLERAAKKALKLQTAVDFDGKKVLQSEFGYQVCVPDGKTVIILKGFTDDTLKDLFVEGKSIDADLQEQIKSVQAASGVVGWFVSTSPNVKEQMARSVKSMLGGVDGSKAAKAVEGCKFVTAMLIPEGRDAKLKVNIECDNDDDSEWADNPKLSAALFASPEVRVGLAFAGDLMGKDVEYKHAQARRGEDALVEAAIEFSLKNRQEIVQAKPMEDATPRKGAPERPSFKQSPLQSALIPDIRPDSIESETRTKTLGRIVFIRVTDKGTVSEGSGFLGAEPELVFTNAHLVGSSYARVDVFLNKGQDNEQKFSGADVEIKGIDRANDLAVLRIVSSKPLPAPLPVELDGCSLKVAQPVYVYGFPGTGAVREASVIDSSVALLRSDNSGVTQQIQVNGGMDLGSSGGPVIDSRGVVVGISRAGIKGSAVNFAIPSEKIRGLLHGRVDDTSIGDPFQENATVKVPVSISFLPAYAPNTSVKDVKLEMWVGPAGAPRPGSIKPPEPVSGDGARKLYELSPRGRQAECDVELPTLTAGQVYWMQASIVATNGVQQWAPAVSFVPDAPPLTVAPAKLVLGGDTAQRTFKLSGKFEFADRSKPKRVETGADFMQVQGLEMVDLPPSGGGVGIKLVLDVHSDFTYDAGGSKLQRNADAQNMVRKGLYSYQGFRSGQLTTFVGPDFGNAAYEARREAENICDKLNSTYRTVSLSVPGKESVRGETWTTTSKWTLDSGRKEMTLQLGCKYLGLRTIDDKALAFVRLSGTMKDSAEPQIVSGYALFDPNLGFYTKVHVKARPEFDNDTGVQNHFETTFERVPGNHYGLEPPIQVVKVTKPDEVPETPDLSKYSDPDLNGLWVVEKELCGERPNAKPYVYKGYEEAIKIDGARCSWVKMSGEYQSNYPPANISGIDTSKKPKPISFFVPASEKKWVGIYKIEGDKLYIATNLDKDNRPKVFATQEEIAGSALYVRVYKRALPGQYGTRPPPQDVVKNPNPNPNPNPNLNPPPPPPPPPPPVVSDPALAGLLAALRSGDAKKAHNAANQLAKMSPSTADAQMRKDIVQALVPLLKHPDQGLHTAAFHAFGPWAYTDGVQTLIGLIGNQQTANIAMDTLAQVSPLQAAQVLAQKLSDPARAAHAAAVLKKLGSVAESALWPLVQNHGNHKLQTEACHILQNIGTFQSLQVLGPLAAGAMPQFNPNPKVKQPVQMPGVDKNVANAALAAAKAIQGRGGAAVPCQIQVIQPAMGGPVGNPMAGPGMQPVGPGHAAERTGHAADRTWHATWYATVCTRDRARGAWASSGHAADGTWRATAFWTARWPRALRSGAAACTWSPGHAGNSASAWFWPAARQIE